MLHTLKHVRDHQNPLTDTTALLSCQAPQFDRPRFAAKKVYRHPQSPQSWYAPLLTLPHLEITGSRYKSSNRRSAALLSLERPQWFSHSHKWRALGLWRSRQICRIVAASICWSAISSIGPTAVTSVP